MSAFERTLIYLVRLVKIYYFPLLPVLADTGE